MPMRTRLARAVASTCGLAAATLALGMAGTAVSPAAALGQEKAGRVKVQTPWLGASRGFLRMGDIEGESKDEEHGGWIDLESVEWEAGGPEDALRAAPSGPVRIQKRLDKSSPLIVQAIHRGTTFPVVRLDAPAGRDQGGAPAYHEVRLEKVRVVSYSVDASGDIPMEEITLTYERITRENGDVRLKGKKILEN